MNLVRNSLHALGLQANHTVILRWSVEGFHSSRPSVEGLAPMGLQTTFNLKVIHLLCCSVKRVTFLLLEQMYKLKGWAVVAQPLLFLL